MNEVEREALEKLTSQRNRMINESNTTNCIYNRMLIEMQLVDVQRLIAGIYERAKILE